MWGIGAITYLLVSGGVSPFWEGSRYRTMNKILKCDYNFDQPNFSLVSDMATDFISKLLGIITNIFPILTLTFHISVLEPSDRSSASASLQHPWMTHIGLDNSLSEKEHWTTLETAWMKSILARRRWQRWYNAIIATHRIRRLSLGS